MRATVIADEEYLMQLNRHASKGMLIAAVTGVIAVIGCIDHSVTGPNHQTAALAVRLLLQDGNGQSGAVGAALPTPIAIKVLDANGLGVAGATVTFSVRKGNGSLGSPTAVSDSTGLARTTWRMGTAPGAASVTAILNNALVLDSVVVTATAVTGAPGIINVTAGDAQNSATGALLPTAIAVQVTDLLGNPVSGVTVAWALPAANLGGAVSPATSMTDANGAATTQWTLGALGGIQVLNVTVAGVAPFPVHANAASPNASATFKIVSGNGQVGSSAGPLPLPLVVSVTDAKGQPMAGVQVNWTQGSGNTDGHVAPSPSVTDATGQASVTWTLGSNSGDSVTVDSVTATLSGNLPGTGTLAFTATVRPAQRIRLIRGTTAGQAPGTQWDTTGATLGDTLVVQVYDPASGKGVQGVTVTWTPQAGDVVDGTAVQSTVATNNLGYAKNIWVMRSNTGVAVTPSSVAKRLVASASGIGNVEFRAIIAPGVISSFTVTQAAVNLHNDSTNTIAVKVKDANGYGIPGASVVVTASDGTVGPTTQTTSAYPDAGNASWGWKFSHAAGAKALSFTVTTTATGPYAGTTQNFFIVYGVSSP